MAAFSNFSPFYYSASAFLYLAFSNIWVSLGWKNFHYRDSNYAGCVNQWITIDLKGIIKDFSAKTVLIVDITLASLIKYIYDTLTKSF